MIFVTRIFGCIPEYPASFFPCFIGVREVSNNLTIPVQNDGDALPAIRHYTGFDFFPVRPILSCNGGNAISGLDPCSSARGVLPQPFQ